MSPFVMDVFSYPVLALRRLLLYPPSTRQTSNASGDDLERQNDRSSPNSVPPFHLVIPGHVQVQPHKYTDGHYLIVVPEATAPALDDSH
jgi:hypothetical protein